jgi:hypothetical protein
MLHTRTVENTGQSEFRPGISTDDNHVDLSNEFAGQYFGDVMLFTIEELSAQGYPKTLPSEETIRLVLDKIEPELHNQYMSKQRLIMQKHAELKQLFNDKSKWWNQPGTKNRTKKLFTRFLDNIENNFGDQSAGYALISYSQYKTSKLENIIQAIMRYTHERTLWENTIK